MTDAEFWLLVAESRREAAGTSVDGSLRRQAVALRQALERLEPAEVVAFSDHLDRRMDAAYHWRLAEAATLIAGGCGDDGFTDFRAWLVSMGQEVFERALCDPDSLVGPATQPDVEDVFFEEFTAVPGHAFEAATGRTMPGRVAPHRSEPQGEKLSETPEALQRRLPRLWERLHRD